MRSSKRAVTSAIIGNFIEWYDFALYTAATPLVFSLIFLTTKQDPFLSQIETIALFSLGFVVRPLGGILFGYIGDRAGPLVALRWTLFFIGSATALIGLLPPCARIGVLAPILLLVLRLIQGLAAGGEWAGSILVIGSGAASRQKRNIALALSQSGVAAGMVAGTAVLWLARQLPDQAFLTWGWRIAFLAALPFAGLGLFLRTSSSGTTSSEVPFSDIPKTGNLPSRRGIPLLNVLRTCPIEVLCGIGLRLAENGGVYIISVFGLAYGHTRHVPDSALLMAVTAGLTADGVAMPLFGWLANRIGCAIVYLGGILFLAALAVPFFSLIASGQPDAVMLAFVLAMMLGHAPMIATEPVLLEDLFPTAWRYTGIAVSHEIGAVLAGGLSPLMAAILFHRTGNVNDVAFYLIALAACSGLALLGLRRHPQERSSFR